MENTTTIYKPTLASVEAAAEKLKGVASVTPLMSNRNYSKQFDANIMFNKMKF